MQSPKSPEKPTRVRKTQKSQIVTNRGGGHFVTKDGSTTTPAATVGRLCQKRISKKTNIKPPSTTDQQFYNEEHLEKPLYEYTEDNLYTNPDLPKEDELKNHASLQSDFATKSKRSSYPELINKMLVLCVNEKDFIKGTCAGRIKSHYQRVFQTYKDKMEPRDRAIVNSGLNYIYNFNRSNSIPKENAVWLISINDIPISHIVSYTNKNILKEIAKDYGISCSNKKAEELIANIREAVEKN